MLGNASGTDFEASQCIPIEFSLNDFPWIQQIHWIMTKFKSSMVTRGITHLVSDTLPVLVIQSVFSLLPLGRYPLPITTPSRYQPRDSSGKLLYTTISRNVTFVRCRMSLVTILLLDLVMIHWIQKKSFRENSNGTLPLDALCVHSLTVVILSNGLEISRRSSYFNIYKILYQVK